VLGARHPVDLEEEVGLHRVGAHRGKIDEARSGAAVDRHALALPHVRQPVAVAVE
jgi:hypothetical protein